MKSDFSVFLSVWILVGAFIMIALLGESFLYPSALLATACFVRLYWLWVQCLINVIKNKTGGTRVKWIFSLFAGGLIAAIVYYYEESRENGRFKENPLKRGEISVTH